MAKMFDKIVMQLEFNNGTKVSLVHPIINVKSDIGGCGNIQGKIEESIWTGEVHIYLYGDPDVHIQYSKELVNVRLLSDQTDFPELCEDIPQIPFGGFSYESYYENLKNIKERFEAFSVLVEEHKKKAIA